MGNLLDKTDPLNKGAKYGKCNRTVCNGTALAYHHGTNAHYCVGCAHDIQTFADRVGDSARFTLFSWDDIDEARQIERQIVLGEVE